MSRCCCGSPGARLRQAAQALSKASWTAVVTLTDVPYAELPAERLRSEGVSVEMCTGSTETNLQCADISALRACCRIPAGAAKSCEMRRVIGGRHVGILLRKLRIRIDWTS